jgi:Fungal Zn(2)-Cys(6) binuclear cluster domain
MQSGNRIRHVKCDEAKPECLKCTSTGRKCDGYAPIPDQHRIRWPTSGFLSSNSRSSSAGGTPGPRDNSFDDITKQNFQIIPFRAPHGYSKPSPSPERQLIPFLGTIEERRALQFFIHRCAPRLSGLHSESFWLGNALKFGLSEPTIRDAVMAVSAMYEYQTMAGISPMATDDTNLEFALTSYNRAIRSLILVAQEKPHSILVPTVAAIIFVCIEHMRGNLKAAFMHTESGINMIKQWRMTVKERPENREEINFIEQELVPVFTGLNVCSGLFGRKPFGLFSRLSDNHGQCAPRQLARNLREATTLLFDIINAVLGFIQTSADVRYQPEKSISLFEEQTRLIKLMQDWLINLKALSTSPSTEDSSEISRFAFKYLPTIYYSIYIWLNECLTPLECSWDKWRSEYEIIVQACEELVRNEVYFGAEFTSRFSFEMGTISPLHFVVFKCRYPHIRRRALALLGEFPRREGPFNSQDSLVTFGRSMHIEEEYLELLPGSIPDENELPPEKYRVHQLAIDPVPTTEGMIIHYLLKQDGPYGPWFTRTECLKGVQEKEWEGVFDTYSGYPVTSVHIL